MKKILILAMLFISRLTTAQDMKIEKGDFTFFKGQKLINVEFDYSNLKMLKDNITEEQYIADRTTDLNNKNSGVGTAWKKKWMSSKEMIWQPKFLELLNIVSTKEDADITYEEGAKNAKYTLIVETVWIFPGWDVSVMKQKAKVSTILKFVETANRKNVLLEISSTDAPGDQWGSNFSNESRIGEGYAKTAKSLSKMIAKKAF